jgi:hypothetical protein
METVALLKRRGTSVRGRAEKNRRELYDPGSLIVP